jgi:hypothetical protein
MLNSNKVPYECSKKGLTDKKKIIGNIIKKALKNFDVFSYRDSLGIYIFDPYFFMDKLMEIERENLEMILRDDTGITEPGIIDRIDNVYFFKKFSKFVENPDPEHIHNKFIFFLDKYLNMFNTYLLCNFNRIIENGPDCIGVPDKHTIYLVNRDNSRINFLNKKKHYGAPITQKDIDELIKNSITTVEMSGIDEKGVSKYRSPKTIFEKAFDNRVMLQRLFPNGNNVYVNNLREEERSFLKNVFSGNFNTTDQLDYILHTVVDYLNTIGVKSYSGDRAKKESEKISAMKEIKSAMQNNYKNTTKNIETAMREHTKKAALLAQVMTDMEIDCNKANEDCIENNKARSQNSQSVVSTPKNPPTGLTSDDLNAGRRNLAPVSGRHISDIPKGPSLLDQIKEKKAGFGPGDEINKKVDARRAANIAKIEQNMGKFGDEVEQARDLISLRPGLELISESEVMKMIQ